MVWLDFFLYNWSTDRKISYTISQALKDQFERESFVVTQRDTEH